MFIVMTERVDGNKYTRKRLTPKDRRKVLDIHIEDPRLTVKGIAVRARMRPSTVYRILRMFKAGKIDRDGFRYENPLCL
jgi:Fe2+ or Zn2+ uptake regulation protein